MAEPVPEDVRVLAQETAYKIGGCDELDIKDIANAIMADRAARQGNVASKLGSWLSAALDDPGVAPEMKEAISEWFARGEPVLSLLEIVDRHQYQYERQPAIWNAFVKLRAEVVVLDRAARPLDAETVERCRIYIDCEFNGWMGELLSFAMVADDGAEFYSVLPEPRTWDDWCFDNVLPVLNKKPVASFDDFRLAFLEFLRGYRNPIIVADWPADLYYFNKVLLGAGHENSVLIPCGMELVSCDYDSAMPHNALEDARAIARSLSPASQGDDTAGRKV